MKNTRIIYRCVVAHHHPDIDAINRKIGPELLISEGRLQLMTKNNSEDILQAYDRLMMIQNEVSKLLIFIHKNDLSVSIASKLSILDGRHQFIVDAINYRHSHLHSHVVVIFSLRRTYGEAQ